MKKMFMTTLAIFAVTFASWAQEAKKADKPAAHEAKAQEGKKTEANKEAEAAKPQPDPTITTVLGSQINAIERNIVPAVEAMPADKFDWAPPTSMGEFKGVKTFAQQAKHVAAVNHRLAAALLGETLAPPIEEMEMGVPALKTKDEIVADLKASYAHLKKAVATVHKDNAGTLVQGPFGPTNKMAPLGMATTAVWHGFDHYGQIVVYLRMNGIIPPASRPRQ